ncbi:hypothetical protein Desaci_1553 [Desulfosporosinus acidiphilus SJ4]|uniref:Uncharacterized protein n=1 Tax=Desulfosporosinus acidiphilus (strain DSM 22704 / JCM 16185 / SJ4) TaxID=646529 RepID=I4D433_DESAJ|nr:hypothetical protein Desaci_1553 [Desulfosporosinus acidiphilus SJ4]
MSCQCPKCKGQDCLCKLCLEKRKCGYARVDDCRWESTKRNKGQPVFLKKSNKITLSPSNGRLT